MAMRDLITYLPHAWPWAGSILALGLPRLVREMRLLIYARIVSRLGQAVIDNNEWSDARVELVIQLIRDVDRNSARRPVASDERPSRVARRRNRLPGPIA